MFSTCHRLPADFYKSKGLSTKSDRFPVPYKYAYSSDFGASSSSLFFSRSFFMERVFDGCMSKSVWLPSKNDKAWLRNIGSQVVHVGPGAMLSSDMFDWPFLRIAPSVCRSVRIWRDRTCVQYKSVLIASIVVILSFKIVVDSSCPLRSANCAHWFYSAKEYFFWYPREVTTVCKALQDILHQIVIR